MTQIHSIHGDYNLKICDEQVNAWLKDNPTIKIVSIEKMRHGDGMYSHNYWTDVTIVYEEPNETVASRSE